MRKVARLGWLFLCVTSAFILAPSPAFTATTAFDEQYLSAPEQKNNDNGELFPEPAELAPNVDFWVDVYTKYNENIGIIHDNVDLDIRYEVIDLTEKYGAASRRSVTKQLSARKKYYAAILINLYRQDGECLTAEECRVAALFGNTKVGWRYRDAIENLRVQYGLANRFRDGLITSGQYMDDMRRVFASYNLPLDLLALPHVESSFNVKAYSRVGAAGIWQFMRSTGRHFMKINGAIDERRDPLLATEAAARFLRGNYAEIGAWPLVVTSYNHGKNGMLRAQRIFGNDIARIVRYYHGPAFGFASRNFYSEFLAARKIMRDPEKYFGAINFKSPLQYQMVRVDAKQVKQLANRYRWEELAALNPALHKQVLQGNKPVPNGYVMRVPHGSAERLGADVVARREARTEEEDTAQDNTITYTVAPRETLFSIAKKFGTTISDIKELNDIGRHRIHAGQKLLLPADKVMAAKAHKPAPQAAKPAPAIQTAQAKPAPAAPARATVKPPAMTAQAAIPVAAATVAIAQHPTPAPVSGMPTPSPESYRLVKAEKAFGVVSVKEDETLGHFAEWTNSSLKDIIHANRWRRAKQLRQGQMIKVPLANITQERFEATRFKYHQGVYNSFFASYRINKVDNHVLRKGQSIWALCASNDDLPLWLLTYYNQGKQLDKLRPGEVIHVPVIERRES